MKKINKRLISSTLVVCMMLLMVACGSGDEANIPAIIESGDLDQARKVKSTLSQKQLALKKDIDRLDSLINSKQGDQNLPLVTTFTTQNKPFDHYIELQGNVTTRQNVLIYPEVAGTLVNVKVKKGQRVSKNQLLAVIDDGGLRNQLLQLKSQLALAKTTFERQEKLWKQDIGSEIQYLQTKTSYESQANAVKQMETQLDKFNIKAPFTGIIDDVIKDQGTVVAPGGPGSEVFRIVNLSNMYIEVDVPETYVASVTKGKKVQVFFPVLGETIDTYVRETGNFINPDNRSFIAEIPVPSNGGAIKPNLTARVKINDYSSEQAILIPQSVISENSEGEQYTYVAAGVGSDNTAKAAKNIVTTGKTQGDFVEILTGLNNGQQVISEGARSVKDGQKVKILMQ